MHSRTSVPLAGAMAGGATQPRQTADRAAPGRAVQRAVRAGSVANPRLANAAREEPKAALQAVRECPRSSEKCCSLMPQSHTLLARLRSRVGSMRLCYRKSPHTLLDLSRTRASNPGPAVPREPLSLPWRW